jgi:restriction system protein
MARRSGFVRSMVQLSRELERQQRAQLKAQERARREAVRRMEQAQKEYQRALATEERAKAAEERQRAAAERAQTKSQKEAAREAEMERKAAEKERARLYLESREAEISARNTDLEERIHDLKNILSATLFVDDYFDLDTLKKPFPETPPFNPSLPPFNPGSLANAEPAPDPKRYAPPPFGSDQPAAPAPPAWDDYLPAPLTATQQFLPWAKKEHEKKMREGRERFEADMSTHRQKRDAEYLAYRQQYEKQVAFAKQRYQNDIQSWRKREAERQQKLQSYKAKYDWQISQMTDKARANYENQIADLHSEIEKHNQEIEQFKIDYLSGDPDAIVKYFDLVLGASIYPEDFPQHAKIAYVPESRQLVIEHDLPPLSTVPEVLVYKYIKSKDEITETPRPPAQRRALYTSLISQIAIRTIHELFEADRVGHLETVVYNGGVETIDPGTGRLRRTCLVTVRTSREVFLALDLRHVEPQACLKTLNADISRSPAELAPVKPVVDFNMVDSRFIEETNVLSALDDRPNLMELSPAEFESLISNLFSKMGLETRLTQSSRDGGVDCVAFHLDPVLGGKFVIQAKRYKHTVGVSAVRDLFGTMQNEGASKGILVTTSGYGKAAFEFAANKPLQLISGSELLYLLEQHAGLKAKIVVPDDWHDPMPDTTNED